MKTCTVPDHLLKPLPPIDAIWKYIGQQYSDNGLLPYDAKLVPESLLTGDYYHSSHCN